MTYILGSLTSGLEVGKGKSYSRLVVPLLRVDEMGRTARGGHRKPAHSGGVEAAVQQTGRGEGEELAGVGGARGVRRRHPFVKENEAFRAELQTMEEKRVKVELESVYCHGIEFFSSTYLRDKIAELI